MQSVQTLKTAIMETLSRRGTATFRGNLTNLAIRAVAELVVERRVRDEYRDGVLHLIVTKKGVE